MKGMKFYSSLLGLALGAAVSTSAVAQDVLKIGELNSYKTQPAFLGPYKNGMELAVEQINAAGGLLGKKVELICYDDAADPKQSVPLAHKLIGQDRVVAFVAGSYSLPTRAVSAIFNNSEIPLVSAYALHPKTCTGSD